MTDTETTLDRKSYHETRWVNQRGHRVLGSDMEKYETDGDEGYDGHAYAYLSRIAAEFFVIDYPEIDTKSIMCHRAFSCGWCDEYASFEEGPDGRMQMKNDCPHADGITTVVEIDVPSGKLICDDSLRDAWDVPEEREDGMAGYNSALGQHQMIQAYAEADYAFGPVGNSCPTLWETDPGKYVVANTAWDDDEDEALPPSFGGKAINSFCTDLWAYSMMDYDKFLAYGGAPIEDDDQNGTRWVMDVPAGKYRLTHHSNEKTFDHGNWQGETVYAHFERIGDC